MNDERTEKYLRQVEFISDHLWYICKMLSACDFYALKTNRRRNLVKYGQTNIDLIRLFSYTLKHYVIYFYEYLCKLKDMRKVFEKNFLSDNTIVQETNGVIIFNM
jgi:hypothetical protein